MSGESSECFPLTQLQDNLHSEILEHKEKREKTQQPCKSPLLSFHASFKTAFNWSCLNWECLLPTPLRHLPASSWEERCTCLQLLIAAREWGLGWKKMWVMRRLIKKNIQGFYKISMKSFRSDLEEASAVWQPNEHTLQSAGNTALGFCLLLLRAFPYGLSRKCFTSSIWQTHSWKKPPHFQSKIRFSLKRAILR